MAKIVKWCAFLVCLTLFTSAPADAMQRRNISEEDCTHSIVEQNQSSGNTLYALISVLFDSAAEFSQMSYHLSFDSKFYLKFLIHPRYSRMYFPASDADVNTCPNKTFFQPERTEYYIYALQKIII